MSEEIKRAIVIAAAAAAAVMGVAIPSSAGAAANQSGDNTKPPTAAGAKAMADKIAKANAAGYQSGDDTKPPTAAGAKAMADKIAKANAAGYRGVDFGASTNSSSSTMAASYPSYCNYPATVYQRDVNHNGKAKVKKVNQRIGASTNCPLTSSPVYGPDGVYVGYPGDSLTYFCWIYDRTTSAYTWTWLQNHTSLVGGWVRDDYLTDNGAYNTC